MGQLDKTTEQIQSFLDGAYAVIFVDSGSSPQTINTGASYTKITAYTDNGDSGNCTADAGNDKLTITEPGVYNLHCSLSFTGAGTNVNWFGAIFAGGVERNDIHFERKIGVGGDYGSTHFAGPVYITSVPVDIDCRVRHDDGSNRDITVKYSNLNATRAGL